MKIQTILRATSVAFFFACTPALAQNPGSVLPNTGFSIVNCGAVPTTNSGPVRAANAAAIAACWAAHPDLLVPAGTFYTDPITAPSGARSIVGIDQNTSKLVTDNNVSWLLKNTNAAPFYVSNLWLEMPYGDTDSGTTLVLANTVGGGVYNSRFLGFKTITTSQVSYFNIKNNFFDKWHWGIIYGCCEGGSNVEITGNTIADFTGSITNTFQAITWSGTFFDISSNVFGYVPNLAVSINGCTAISDFQVTHNTIKGIYGEKISLDAASTCGSSPISRFKIAGNLIDYTAAGGGTDFGLDLNINGTSDISDGEVIGNTLVKSGYAFTVGRFGSGTGNVTNVMFANNHCINTGVAVVPNSAPAWFGACFQVNAGSLNNTFYANHASDVLGNMTAWIWELAGANNNVAQGNWGTPGTTKNYVLVGSTSKAMDASALNGGNQTTNTYTFMSPSSSATAGTELDFGATGTGKFASIRSSLTNGAGGTVGDLIFAAGFGAATDYWRFTGASGAWAPVTSGVGSIGDSAHGIAGLYFGGSTSGVGGFIPPAVLGTRTWALPTNSGTMAVSAIPPIELNATTGAIACPTCTTTANGVLTFGTYLTAGGSSYNGLANVTISTNATPNNSTNTIVARNGSGNIGVGDVAAATFNGNTITPGTGTLTLGAGKTLTASNTLTFTGTDGSSVAFGAGGTALFNGGALGTPSSGVATNLTGTAGGLTSGNVTTNANLTGDVTSIGNATTLTNAPVIAKVLTGFVSGAGTVSATDSILTAIQKINGNDALKAPIASPTFTGTVTIPSGSALGTPTTLVATNATGTASGLTAGNVTTNANLTGDVTSVGNATTLTNAPVIAKVLTGYASGSGTVSASDSILSAIQKLNGNDALKLPLGGGTMSGAIAMGGNNISGAGTIAANTSVSAPSVTINGGVPNAMSFTLSGANFNTTADQAIAITLPTGFTHWVLAAVFVSNPSVSLTTAAGGVYSAASKGGTALIPASQAYSALTTNTAGSNGSSLNLVTFANANTTYFNAGNVYLSLTTAQGSAATADITVTIRPLP